MNTKLIEQAEVILHRYFKEMITEIETEINLGDLVNWRNQFVFLWLF